MKVSLIRFPYSDSRLEPLGSRSLRKIGVALLIENGLEKVVVTERPGDKTQSFQLMGKDQDSGTYKFKPQDCFAILPETEYEIVSELGFPDDMAATLFNSVEFSSRLYAAQKRALQIVQPARQAAGG